MLALFSLLTLGAVAYLNVHLANVERGMRLANERWAAWIATLNVIQRAASEVNAPGNDAFASRDIAGETVKLNVAVAKLRSGMRIARAQAAGDPAFSRRLADIDVALAPMLMECAEVFRLLSLHQVEKAALAMSRLDRADKRMRSEIDGVRAVLRVRQLQEFARQSSRSRSLALEQKFGLGVMALLVMAFFGYGRLLDREIFTARERERVLLVLKEREDALRAVIAERDAQHDDLIREQQLLSDAQRIARLGAFELDLVTNRLWWSDAMYSLFGLRVGQIEPSLEASLERVVPSDRERMSSVMVDAIADRAPFAVEFRIIAADGTERLLSSVGRVDVGDDGQPLRMRGVAQDITERKWAEDQLMRQEAQLAEAQRIARMGSWELDVQSQTVTWSDELHGILGYASGEVRPCFRAYMSLLPPDEKRRVYGLLRTAMTEGDRFEFEHTLVRKDGVEIQMLVRGVIDRDERNDPIHVLGVSQDITARKKGEADLRLSEERFQLASRATNDIVWDRNLTDNTLWFNEGFSSRLGYPLWGTVDAALWHAAIHADDTQRVKESIQSAIQGTAKDWACEYRFRDARGACHEILDRGYIVRDGAGNAVRIIGAMMDITERRAVERMKDEFISTVSHELRTPLTSIRGALGLLSSGRLGTLPEKGQRLLEIASVNTDRLVRLINDILDIERMESGKVTLEKVECDGADLVRQAVDTVRALADRERVTIEVDIVPTPMVVDCDRLIQTLTNLLGNAVKFSPQGSTVTASLTSCGRDAVFSVSDRGRGIPAEKLATIFERFQQVDATDAREKGGSGLGLAISRGIARQHGGDIAVESEIGGGSTFTLTIPKGTEHPAPQAPPARKLIYLCDDDEDTREVLKFFLAERGYRTLETATGDALINALRTERPDAILLDLFMPYMNGWETLARLKNDPEFADVPVVVVSVLAPDETGATGLELAGWVQKPLDEKALAGVLERAFRQKARRPRLVLVEDDADLASVIIASFERYGIETIHARTGDEAIELARRVDPDLLILDLILPGLDGYGVIDWLKDNEVWRGLPLVVYSATEPTPSQRERLKLGYTEFMTKSRVAPEEFERRIVALLDTLTAKIGVNRNVA